MRNLPAPPSTPIWRKPVRWEGSEVHTFTRFWFDARRLVAEALGIEETLAGELLGPDSKD